MNGQSGSSIWGSKKKLTPPEQNNFNNNQYFIQLPQNNQRNMNNNSSESENVRSVNALNNVFTNNSASTRMSPSPINQNPFMNQQNSTENRFSNRQPFSNKFDVTNLNQRENSAGELNRAGSDKQINNQRMITKRLNETQTSHSPQQPNLPYQNQPNISAFQENPRNRFNPIPNHTPIISQNVANYSQTSTGAFKNRQNNLKEEFRNSSNLNKNQANANMARNIFNNQIRNGQSNSMKHNININGPTNQTHQQGVNDTLSSITMDDDMNHNFQENYHNHNPQPNKFKNSVPEFEFTNEENSLNYSFKAQDSIQSVKDFRNEESRNQHGLINKNQQNVKNSRSLNKPNQLDKRTRQNPKFKNTETIREDNEYDNDNENIIYENELLQKNWNKNKFNPNSKSKENIKFSKKDDNYYFQQVINSNKDEYIYQDEDVNVIPNKIDKESANNKLGLIRKKNFKKKVESNYNNKEVISPSNNIQNLTSSSPKPRIDLSKISKLKNKQSEFIECLENKTRKKSLSPSPIGVNLIASRKEDDRLEKYSQKEKTLENYIPKNMGQYINSATEKAKLVTMCSPREMKAREEQNILNILESDPKLSYYDANQKRYVIKVNPDNAVKVFSRPAADTVMDDPENIRPPIVLAKTINYLLEEIVDIDTKQEKQKKIFRHDGLDLNFENISKFVEDRFRSIRQDFTILNLKGDKNNIDGHEKIARFLILCLNETLDYDAFSGQQSLFKLYVQQLNATMTSLREFYQYVEQRQSSESIININSENFYVSPNQAEFYSYSILLSIKETFDLVSMLNKMPDKIRDSTKIKLTLKVVRAIMGKEWISFFRILKSKECDYLLSCIMSLYFKEMRSAALSELSHSFGINNRTCLYKTTIEKLNEIVLFEDKEECLSFLEWFGNDISEFSNVNEDLEIEKIPFELITIGLVGEDANLPRKTNRKFIDEKRKGSSRCEIIKGEIKINSASSEEHVIPESTIVQSKKPLPPLFPKEKAKKDIEEKISEDMDSTENYRYISRVCRKEDIDSENKNRNEIIEPESLLDKKEVKIPLEFASKDMEEIKQTFEKSIITQNLFISTNEYINQIAEERKTHPPPSQTSESDISPFKYNFNMQSDQDVLKKLDLIEAQFKKDMENIEIAKSEIKPVPQKSVLVPAHINKYTSEKLEKFSNKIKEMMIKSDQKLFYETLQLNIEHEKHLEDLLLNFKNYKKRKLFVSFINFCEDIKWNRYYIKELIKMKMGIIDINRAFEYKDQNIIQRKNFFNYNDLKKSLVKKLLEKEQRTEEISHISAQNLYHLKICLFTHKSMFASTKILQNLFFPQNYCDFSNVKIDEGENFIKFSDINNYDQNLNSNFSIFINVFFIDQIEDMSDFINENFESLNKFSYGLIYMDYRDINILQKLTLLLDYATRDIPNKDILLINYYKLSFNTLDRDDIKNNISLLKEMYPNCLRSLPSDNMLFPLSEYSSFFNYLLEFFNNQEIFNIFDREIEIQKFENFKSISVYDYVKKLKISDMVLKYEYSKKNFVSYYDKVTELNWIRFFTHFEFLLTINKYMSLIIKQSIHQIDSNLDSILKVPIELYVNKSNDLNFIYNFINAKNIFCYLYKNLNSIDIIGIFTEVIKEPSFDFERFMMQPKFYSIFSIYLQKLFILFANINNMFNLEIPNYREKLLIYLDHVKVKYTMHTWDSIYFDVLLNFFEQFLNLINLRIPLKNEENLIIEKSLFDEKMNEIKCRVDDKLIDLIDLFICTGLGHYMSRDENLLNKFDSHLKFDMSKEEYVVLSNVDKLDSEFEDSEDKSSFSLEYIHERKEYHIKMKYIVDKVEGKIHDLYSDQEEREKNSVMYLGKKTGRKVENTLINKKDSLDYEERKNNKKICTQDINKLLAISSRNEYSSKSRLKFTPQVITYKL